MPHSLKILIIGNLAPYRIGGAEVQARLLAAQFVRRGHVVTVAGYGNSNGRIHARDGSHGGIETVHLRRLGRRRLTRGISYACSLTRYLLGHARRFDIVLCYMLGESDIVISLLKRFHLIDLPMVACTAGYGPGGDAARLMALPASTKLMAVHRRQCNAINIISPSIEKELVPLGYGPDFAHIPNGVPLCGDPSPEHSHGNGVRSFLFAGRLVRLKGCEDLLAAVRILKDQAIPFRVNIVGDGTQAPQLRRLANAYQIEDRVTFHGVVAPDAMAEHYRNNTVLVLPSWREAQGMVVAEAMSFGRPVIVTRCGGPEFTVDERMARICPKADPSALAIAMEEMLAMPADELRAMGGKARQHTAENYDIEKTADRFIDLLYRITGKSS